MDILIVSKPGRMRDGLLTMVQSFERVGEACAVSSEAEVLAWLNGHPTSLVIIDFDLASGAADQLLNSAKTAGQETKFLIITDCRGQYSAACQKGVDVVLERGFSAEHLHQAILR